MSKVLRGIAFVAVFVAANEGLCRAYEWFRYAANPTIATETQSHRYQDRYTTLFFGDSVFATGVDPRRIPDAYNFAWLGANFRESYFTLDWILRSQPTQLKTVVIQVDRHSFSGRRMNNFWFIQKASFATVLRADFRDRRHGRYLREWTEKRLVPYVGIVDQIQKWTKTGLPERHMGFMPLYESTRPPNAVTSEAAQRALANLFAEKSWFDASVRWYLEEIIRLAEARGIRVVLVHAPVSAAFDREIQSYVSDAQFAELIDSIRSAHPKCIVLNHQDLYADRDAMFWNSNHLENEGAAAWTDRLRSDLVRHGLIPERGV